MCPVENHGFRFAAVIVAADRSTFGCECGAPNLSRFKVIDGYFLWQRALINPDAVKVEVVGSGTV